MAAVGQALCCSSSSCGGIDAHARGRSFATRDGGRHSLLLLRQAQRRPPICRLRCVAESEPNDFWTRVQKAWRVLTGTTSERQRVKQRFNNLLVRDRGFSSTNLARLYNVAKGAIEQHVDLEPDEEAEVVTAYVERVGELRLDFRVKRVKSILADEPYAGVPMSISEIGMKSEGSELGSAEKRDEKVQDHQTYEHQVDANPSAVAPDLEFDRVLQSSSDPQSLSSVSIIEESARTAVEVER
ncbi:hypothetical protein MPTK1_5g11560 [Marchantia polymorpha subsp. ruderalis]|uniref:Uncharacterized protein n=2 Tax=Marchantia polymorpha TaxID=3197 RepID=A0AAF6BHB6_MARPO|nr:hypothetical protein MARPO_0093s0079 [Marchantia polymorpha]BBN11400.1 hypothetical protein Mp_5g11560 [Marchantia polymorpha subsp. ruderalis]|eukprot:PTQ33013.1 hypothetical protein MARPO_0093s0079 [Marchantia polymorpha]